MECKFIEHGVAISYDQVIKPCCYWKIDQDWKNTHHITKANIVNWHSHADIVNDKNQLAQGRWPEHCVECKKIESQGRTDSGRGNAQSAYAHYQPGDITLEIRPGSVCNFACQTCWPSASSRVAQYHSQAGLIDIKNLDSTKLDDFDFLLPIAHRIRDVVLLGGEPFYDKSCRKFLAWAQQHLNANLIMFTNGSVVDYNFVKNYRGKLTLVFSLDAVGRPAEYVRVGTVWNEVWSNFQHVRKLTATRVNITCSIYNYHHIESLVSLLAADWPEVVSFGSPREDYLRESSIPTHLRADIIASLQRAIDTVESSQIEIGQKQNATAALRSIVSNLESLAWNPTNHRRWCNFVNSMDQVKNLNAREYCNTLGEILDYVHQVA